MLSIHKIQVTLEEMKDISRLDMALYNERGKLVAATFDQKEDLEEAVINFAESMAESQMLAGSHFFKVLVVLHRGSLYGWEAGGMPDSELGGSLQRAV